MTLIRFKECGMVPLLFDETTEKIFFMEFMQKNYKIKLENKYLARKNIETKKIEYFHRFAYEKYNKTKIGSKQIHHKNGNRLDNKIKNLLLIDEKQHEKIHTQKRLHRWDNAFDTWQDRTGNDDIEEFIDWLEDKGENRQELENWAENYLYGEEDF